MTNARDFLGKKVTVHIDRPLGSCHPNWGFEYGLNYGYIPHTISGDGEELDAYILGVDAPLERFDGICIAILHRLNDDDDKLIVVPDGEYVSDEEIREQTDFQEKYFKSTIIR